jgi:putative hemolysin
MDPAVFEIAFIFLLIAANGIFAMSEIAVVSAERFRLQQRADAGDVGARRALELVKSPSRFFSTIQLGITSIGILAGVIGGATLASRFATWLSASVLAAWADTIAIGTVVVAITYVSLVVGELVPKRIGLGYAEQIAVKLAPTMHWFSRVAAPAVTVLSFSTDAVLRLLRARQAPEPAVTEEGIKRMLEQATLTGVVEPAEREMVERVFRLGDRLVTDIMTPYPDIIWLDLADSRGLSQRKVTTSGHSHFPVIRDRRDNIAGIVHAKDLVIQSLAGHPLDLESALQPALFVPETTPAADVLERFREAGTRVALVIDEYGSLQGMITTDDLLQALVGEIPEHGEEQEPSIVRRADGSWLVDGAVPIDELEAICRVQGLSGLADRGHRTVGGFVMTKLGRVPRTGDHFEWAGYRFEVVDMDRRRVDKVLVEPPAADGRPSAN